MGPPGAGSASTSASPGSRSTRPGRAAASLPEGEGVGLAVGRVARQPPARVGHLPSRGGRPDHRGHRRGRHLGHDDRVRGDRGRGPRPVGGRRVGHLRRHRVRAALPGEWRQRHHLFDRPRARPAPRPQLRDKILAYAAQVLEIDVSDLELVDGAVQPRGTPDRALTLAEIGRKLDGFGGEFEPLEGHAGSVPPNLAPLTSAHLVHVRVDAEIGRGRGARLRHRPGRRAGDQPGRDRGPAPRRRDPGPRLGAARGDGLRRGQASS